MESLYYLTDNAILSSSLLLSMFFLSGIQKVYKFPNTVDNLRGKIGLNLPDAVYQLLIVLVILLEIMAPVIILYFLFTNQMKQIAYYAALGLVLFTIVATILYHPPVFMNYYKSLPFWANVSLTGGLLLLAKHIKSKIK
jgi:uncharacterized membrane protein YphA (DoxX/SURF4 family)